MKAFGIVLSIFLLSSVAMQGQVEYDLEWNHEIEVSHGMDMIDKEQLYCYSTMVYEVGKGDIRKKIQEEIQQRSGDKVKKKSLLEGVRISMPKYTEDLVTLKVKSEDMGGAGTVKLTVALIHDSLNVSPDITEAHEAALEMVYEMGVQLNKAVVTIQLDEAKAVLADLEKERLKLIQEKEKLQNTITTSEDKIVKLEANTSKLESKVTEAKSDAASLEAAANASTATSKDMKAYTKAKDKVTKAESSVLKNKENIMKEKEKINAANVALPTNDEATQENLSAMEAQKEIVSKLEAKLEAVK